MAALDRQNEPNTGMAQNPRVAEPRLLRHIILANCAIILAALGMLLIGRETGQVNLALAGVVVLAIATVGWTATFVWIATLLVQDIRATRGGYRITSLKLPKRGRNHQIDAKRS